MSEFVYLFRATEAEQREAMGTPEHAQKSMQAWLAWMRGLEASGHLKDPGQPLDRAGQGRPRRARRWSPTAPTPKPRTWSWASSSIEARDLAQAVELASGCPMLEGVGLGGDPPRDHAAVLSSSGSARSTHATHRDVQQRDGGRLLRRHRTATWTGPSHDEEIGKASGDAGPEHGHRPVRAPHLRDVRDRSGRTRWTTPSPRPTLTTRRGDRRRCVTMPSS